MKYEIKCEIKCNAGQRGRASRLMDFWGKGKSQSVTPLADGDRC
ncbi:hypothetical protein lacNasYZ02_08650 [Lactobacillus nasalidis]|nr:hypothetical protein lacNasYZ02_08650 [Lactobacillus nasalidis]